jgi:hypothetical protein
MRLAIAAANKKRFSDAPFLFLFFCWNTITDRRIASVVLKNTPTAVAVRTATNKFNLIISSNTEGIMFQQRPSNVKRGYPVGCAIPSVQATTASSPESVNPTERHIVVVYTQNETSARNMLMAFSLYRNIRIFFITRCSSTL